MHLEPAVLCATASEIDCNNANQELKRDTFFSSHPRLSSCCGQELVVSYWHHLAVVRGWWSAIGNILLWSGVGRQHEHVFWKIPFANTWRTVCHADLHWFYSKNHIFWICPRSVCHWEVLPNILCWHQSLIDRTLAAEMFLETAVPCRTAGEIGRNNTIPELKREIVPSYTWTTVCHAGLHWFSW